MTTVYDKYLRALAEFNAISESTSMYSNEIGIKCILVPDGMAFDIHTNSTVYSFRLNREQAIFLRNFINEMFIDAVNE